jgi:hydrogenase-1 operon protein HyaE
VTAQAADARPATLHPLFERLFAQQGCANLDAGRLDAFLAAPGHALLFFAEDPVQYRETLDLCVILPEIARAFRGRFRVGVLLPQAARAVAPKYGFRRWPALVMLRDGGYVGAIDGLRDWDDYLAETARLLEAPVVRPPSIGIPVHPAGGPSAPTCH